MSKISQTVCLSLALLCIIHSSFAMNCYDCQNCQLSRENSVSCEYGAVCGKYDISYTSYTGRTETAIVKGCHRQGANCREIERDDRIMTFIRGLSGQRPSVYCNTCADRDHCNHSAMLYPSIATIIATILFLITSY